MTRTIHRPAPLLFRLRRPVTARAKLQKFAGRNRGQSACFRTGNALRTVQFRARETGRLYPVSARDVLQPGTRVKQILWLLPVWVVALFGQTPADFERSVRAAMAPSLAQQQISVQKQVASVARGRPVVAGSPFFESSFPVTAGVLAECDPMPADQLDGLIRDNAQKQGVSAQLVRAVIDQESAARPCAVSIRGAQGLMQLMPATADQFEVQDAFDPGQNIEAETKLLRILLNRYDNDLSLALGAYNAGPARVDREGGIPAIPETLNYVAHILEQLGKKADRGSPAPSEGIEDRRKQ